MNALYHTVNFSYLYVRGLSPCLGISYRTLVLQLAKLAFPPSLPPSTLVTLVVDVILL